MKMKIYRILFYAIAVLLLWSIYVSCNHNKDIERLNNNLTSIGIENQKFKVKELADGKTIASQNQIIITQKEAIDNNLIEIDNIKNVKSKVRFVSETKIDTLFIPFNVVKVDSSSNVKADDKMYFDFKEPKGWYSIGGYVNSQGVGISKMSVTNDYSIYIADKKMGWFKKSQPEVILLNKNPYSEVTNMSNIIIKTEKPFYKRNAFWLGVGVVGGTLLLK